MSKALAHIIPSIPANEYNQTLKSTLIKEIMIWVITKTRVIAFASII